MSFSYDEGGDDGGGDDGGGDGWDGDACTMPDHSIHVTSGGSVFYHSSSPIAGFQFNHTGCVDAGSITSGDAPDIGVTALASLNPEDIESIEVIKGPAGASSYGTGGSNGVVLITTKRGKVGSSDGDNWKMSYKGTFGTCLLYTSPSPRDATLSRMPSSA